ncbi:MAG: hypothetical protein ACTSRZ_05585 [Promethearchaeota archaeon]
MEELTQSIEDIVHAIVSCDPAIYRVIITDRQGLEIASYVKHWNRRPNEEKNKNPIYPLLNTICLNAEKFLNFLRDNKISPFIFTWNFERGTIFASSLPIGFIGVFCEADVNPGLVKKILKRKTIQYYQIVKDVFVE